MYTLKKNEQSNTEKQEKLSEQMTACFHDCTFGRKTNVSYDIYNEETKSYEKSPDSLESFKLENQSEDIFKLARLWQEYHRLGDPRVEDQELLEKIEPIFSCAESLYEFMTGLKEQISLDKSERSGYLVRDHVEESRKWFSQLKRLHRKEKTQAIALYRKDKVAACKEEGGEAPVTSEERGETSVSLEESEPEPKLTYQMMRSTLDRCSINANFLLAWGVATSEVEKNKSIKRFSTVTACASFVAMLLPIGIAVLIGKGSLMSVYITLAAILFVVSVTASVIAGVLHRDAPRWDKKADRAESLWHQSEAESTDSLDTQEGQAQQGQEDQESTLDNS